MSEEEQTEYFKQHPLVRFSVVLSAMMTSEEVEAMRDYYKVWFEESFKGKRDAESKPCSGSPT